MAIFAIGDTHLSFSTDKPMTVFKGWDDYVPRLEAHWRSVVRETDTVVLPGDISWAMSLEEAEADFAFLNRLPGEKIILKGNHDYWWNTRRKMEAFFEEKHFTTLKILHNNAFRVGSYSICGTRGWFFDAESASDEKVLLREVARLRTSIQAGRQLGGEPLVFLHYPPLSLTQSCSPFLELLESEQIRHCYYGHLHGGAMRLAFQGERNGVHYALVSADSLKFCPQLLFLHP